VTSSRTFPQVDRTGAMPNCFKGRSLTSVGDSLIRPNPAGTYPMGFPCCAIGNRTDGGPGQRVLVPLRLADQTAREEQFSFGSFLET
jgi:hypothetical protein